MALPVPAGAGETMPRGMGVPISQLSRYPDFSPSGAAGPAALPPQGDPGAGNAIKAAAALKLCRQHKSHCQPPRAGSAEKTRPRTAAV